MISQATENQLSPRLRAMRDRVIQAPQEISLVRARAITETIKNNPGLPRGVQLAMGVGEAFRRLPIAIGDDERIVGALTEKFKGALLYPELKSDFLLKELDNFEERELDRFAISEAEKRELREEILPYWEGRSAFDDMLAAQSDKVSFGMRNVLFVINNDFMGDNHLAHLDYAKVLRNGFAAIKEEAATAAGMLSDGGADVRRKRDFYQSVTLSVQAVMDLAARYSRLASELSGHAHSEAQSQAFREIAEIAARVPAQPARTFREAVQSFWFTLLALSNLDGAMEIPLGRLDQFLYPYYRQDLDEGRITRDEALELLSELFIKCNQATYLVEYAASKVMDGNNMRLTVTVGGVDAAGRDATNPLSSLILEAVDGIRLTRPNVAVRLHPGAPEPFRTRVVRMMTGGANIIQVFNDEVMIAGYTRLAFSIEAARDYVLTGCVQPIPSGTYGPTCSAFINGPKLLELVLNGGRPFVSLSGEEEDLPAPRFASYQELWAAFKAQAKDVVEDALEGLRAVGEVQERLLPNPLISAVMDGALENGRDVKAGGARHNVTGVDLIGLGTLADSLAALREVVYERRSHPLAEVVEWLKADFEGYEPQRQLLLNRAAKYGNDEPRADEIARDIVDWLDEILREHRPYRGGRYTLGLHSETHHVIQAVAVAATPDGRHAGEMFSPGCGPVSGRDRRGPTASLRSIATVDYAKVMGGASANLRFNPTVVRTLDGVERFGDMLRGYFRLGGQHLQVNVVDAETLRDAQRNPDQYQDLIVRVTGYSARFVELTPGTQEEIIRRTEMNMCG